MPLTATSVRKFCAVDMGILPMIFLPIGKILVRAIGPTLTDFGIQGALADPTLELHDSNGNTLSNDDCREIQESDYHPAEQGPGAGHSCDLGARELHCRSPGQEQHHRGRLGRSVQLAVGRDTVASSISPANDKMGPEGVRPGRNQRLRVHFFAF